MLIDKVRKELRTLGIIPGGKESGKGQPSCKGRTAENSQVASPGQWGIVVGVSGGPDSVCLLDLLSRLASEEGFFLAAVHVNHRLRKEAKDDAAFVRELCLKRGIPLSVYERDVAAEAAKTGETVEEAGRRLRYACLLEEARRRACSYIAVAHQREDNAETMLFHLARGSGLAGLSGMERIREMTGKDDRHVQLIRPLLNTSRAEILSYLREYDLPYREDCSNHDLRYARNRIRHQILPELEKINTEAVLHINQAEKLLSEVNEYVTEEARKALSSCRSGDGVEAAKFRNFPPFLQRQMALLFLSEAMTQRRDVNRIQVEALCDLTGKPDGARLDLPGGYQALREGPYLFLRKRDRRGEGAFLGENAGEFLTFSPIEIKAPAEILLPGGELLRVSLREKRSSEEIPKTTCTKWFDYDRISGILILRPGVREDWIPLPGGGRKTLRRIWIDGKIPRRQRDQTLVLAMGKEILWILGDQRSNDKYYVTEGTRRILEVSLETT